MTTKTPRWQAQMSSRFAAFTGGLWLIAGVGELVLGITAGSVWNVVIGSGFLVCCLLWPMNAVIWRRRQLVEPRPSQRNITRPTLWPSSTAPTFTGHGNTEHSQFQCLLPELQKARPT